MEYIKLAKTGVILSVWLDYSFSLLFISLFTVRYLLPSPSGKSKSSRPLGRPLRRSQISVSSSCASNSISIECWDEERARGAAPDKEPSGDRRLVWKL